MAASFRRLASSGLIFCAAMAISATGGSAAPAGVIPAKGEAAATIGSVATITSARDAKIAVAAGQTSPESTVPQTVADLAKFEPATRLRRLHLVRPDLILYPIAYDVIC